MAARRQALARTARRAWPVILAAYQRWESLSAEEKERYKRQAREAVERGRRAVEQRRGGRGGGGRFPRR